jgi:hypothetical protein
MFHLRGHSGYDCIDLFRRALAHRRVVRNALDLSHKRQCSCASIKIGAEDALRHPALENVSHAALPEAIPQFSNPLDRRVSLCTQRQFCDDDEERRISLEPSPQPLHKKVRHAQNQRLLGGEVVPEGSVIDARQSNNLTETQTLESACRDQVVGNLHQLATPVDFAGCLPIFLRDGALFLCLDCGP